MTPQTLELMQDQVCAIYRALTGTDLIVPEAPSSGPPEAAAVDEAELERRFADLEALARSLPAVGERVPPFSFHPPVDVLDEGPSWLIELAVPGVAPEDVSAERRGDVLTISGLRRGERAGNGRTYLHAEIPRGPFSRTVALPGPVGSDPDVTVERGVVLIRLAKAVASPQPER